jgi:2-dehydropantoate 2-reductase
VLGEFGQKIQERTRAIARRFQNAKVRCHLRDDLALERWRKLIWNIPFNGLSILTGGCDTRGILSTKELCATTVALMREVIAAANKCGHALPNDAWKKQIERTEAMPGYKPSTLSDWEAGKPLEIEAIWGEPLRRGNAAGAHMPLTEMMYVLLKQLEDNSQTRTSRFTALSNHSAEGAS